MALPTTEKTPLPVPVGLRALFAVVTGLGWGHALSCSGEASPCGEVYQPVGARCEVSRVSCATPETCPASWSLAQAATTCGAGRNETTLGACGAKRAWGVSYGSPPLFLTCYYDATSGALEGILRESDADVYCHGRSSELAYGIVPRSCDADPNEMSFRCP